MNFIQYEQKNGLKQLDCSNFSAFPAEQFYIATFRNKTKFNRPLDDHKEMICTIRRFLIGRKTTCGIFAFFTITAAAFASQK